MMKSTVLLCFDMTVGKTFSVIDNIGLWFAVGNFNANCIVFKVSTVGILFQ